MVCFVFILALFAAIWRYSPLMPQVFFGDDLAYFLAFKDGQCGTTASQLLTTVCADKFRPLPAGLVLLMFNLFDSTISYYMVVNLLLQATSATLVFLIALHLSKGRVLVAFSIAMAVSVSRFAAYQVTQVIGPVEGLALPLFLGIIYSILRADEIQEKTFHWGVVAILLAFLLIHNHERYIVITAWLGLAFIFLPSFRALSRINYFLLLTACAAIPIFYVAYKINVLHSPFLVGTGGRDLSIDIAGIAIHIKQAALSIVGFNEGPEYLVGIRLMSLSWFPAWILASIVAVGIGLTIFHGIRDVFLAKPKLVNVLLEMRWLILLAILIPLLLMPPVLTIRLEQRWLFAPFILLLLMSAWAVGQLQGKIKWAPWLIGVVSFSAVVLDSMIVSHFNQVFYVNSARFAEMTKKDIADKYPGLSTPIGLLVNPDHCNWTLMKGGFFRIYGGQMREVSCLSLNDNGEAILVTNEGVVYMESTLGQLSEITTEWNERILAGRGRTTFDFIKNFSEGRINNSDQVDTPSGMGALLLPVNSIFGIENTLTLISGFSYQFDDILIERGSKLNFGIGMIYPADPINAAVYIREKYSGKEHMLFTRKVEPPVQGGKQVFSLISIPLESFVGKRVSIVFASDPTSQNTSAQWLGYSNPRIILQDIK